MSNTVKQLKKNVNPLLPFYFNAFAMTFFILIMQVRAEPTASKKFNYFPYFAYSPNGTVEGELVYINRGLKSDIDLLNLTGISLKNKIVIARSVFARVGTTVLGCFMYKPLILALRA